jgi:polysaccharide pyruvyl transferase WcaK-like protein
MEERKRRFTFPWSRSVRMEPLAFFNYLASHSFVITGRYHTVTLALAAGVPFVALESNTPKISWLLQDALGDTRRVVQVDQLQKSRLSEFAQWTPEEDKAIRRFVLDAASRTNEMFAQIRQSIMASSGKLKETAMKPSSPGYATT